MKLGYFWRFMSVIFFYNCSEVLAQTITITTPRNVSDKLLQLVKSCEGTTQDLKLQYGAHPFDTYLKVVDCQFVVDREVPNNSLKWEGDAIKETKSGIGQDLFPYAEVQVVKTGKYRVSWTERTYYPTSRPCSDEPGIVDVVNYSAESPRNVYFIPNPPKPTIDVPKAILMNGETTTLKASSCPNTLKDQTEYPLLPPNSATWWSPSCSDLNNFTKSGQEIYIRPGDQDNSFYGIGVHTFVARCDDNGCTSELSDPVSVAIQSRGLKCYGVDLPMVHIPFTGWSYDFDSAETDAVEKGRGDYHYFRVETTICNINGINPNCTVQKVFDLLKNNKDLNKPTFPSIPQYVGKRTDLIELKATTLLSNLQSIKSPNYPVQECGIIYSEGLTGYAGTFVASFTQLPIFTTAIKATAEAPLIANPSIQMIDETNYSIVNYTLPGHILHKSKEVRTVVRDCDKIKIITIGTGLSQFGDNVLGRAMAKFNGLISWGGYQNTDNDLVIKFWLTYP